MDPSSVALQGLRQADIQLEAAAAGIARAGATSPDGANLDVVDLSNKMVALMSAKTLFEANLATLETAGQVQKSLIDTTA
jgi:flagellar hook protein FlgE